MTTLNSVIPAPPNTDEKPFDIGDKLTVFEAAMVYAGRHPHPLFLKDGSIDDHLEFLRARIPKQPRSRNRVRARRSWDIYCELVKRIKQDQIKPIRAAYDPAGEIDPVNTVISTADLVQLAIERGEQPKYLRHLQTKTTARHPAPKMTKREAVEAFVKEKYPDSIPAYKTIAHEFEVSPGGCRVDLSTIARALGRK